MQIENLRTECLVSYARNSRTHSDEQVGQIAASITEFGFNNPVLIDEEGVLIAGHGRVMAARKLGLETVPCIRLAHLSEDQKRAYIIADNNLALNAGWDMDLLQAEMLDLHSNGFNIDLLGFDNQFMHDLFEDSVTETDPDDAPPLPVTPISEVGDVWLLDQHRLICGDSTSTENMQELMRGEMADACWTDPPYNVNYGDKADFLNNGDTTTQRNTDRILNDNLDDASFKKFLGGFYRSAWSVMKPGAAIYVAHSETERHNFTEQFIRNGFKLSGCVIWKKNALVLGRSDYQWIHEPILYGWKVGAAHKWYGGRKKISVKELPDHGPFVERSDGKWEIRMDTSVLIIDGQAVVEELLPSVILENKPTRNDIHPTMKPVALIERMLANSARRGDIVLDPFGGSGSTLMACERLGMRARLSELSSGYADVIVQRWQKEFKKIAIHEKTGKSFESLMIARREN